MASRQRRLSAYRALPMLTEYNQTATNILAHIVAIRHMVPVSQKGRKAAQHTVRNASNVGVPDTFRGFANQRRNMKIIKASL